MALSVCFRRPVILGNFLYQQMRGIIVPAWKTSAFRSGLSSKTFKGSKVLPNFQPVKSISTSMIRRQEEKPHDHAKLWIVEKATTACLLILIPFGLLIPNRLVDTLLAVLITAHAYWGMEALVVEYVRVLLFGPQIPKVAMSFVYGITVLLLGGLFFLNFNDIGMCRGFWRIWRNMRKPVESRKGGKSSPGCP